MKTDGVDEMMLLCVGDIKCENNIVWFWTVPTQPNASEVERGSEHLTITIIIIISKTNDISSNIIREQKTKEKQITKECKCFFGRVTRLASGGEHTCLTFNLNSLLRLGTNWNCRWKQIVSKVS